jgi:transcriptional regulator NrdR family protein
MVTVVKRRGHKENFNEEKAYASVYSACMECSLGVQKCEDVSQHIMTELKHFLKTRKEVNSTEIFGFILQKLAKISEPAAFMYETHRELPKA